MQCTQTYFTRSSLFSIYCHNYINTECTLDGLNVVSIFHVLWVSLYVHSILVYEYSCRVYRGLRVWGAEKIYVKMKRGWGFEIGVEREGGRTFIRKSYLILGIPRFECHVKYCKNFQELKNISHLKQICFELNLLKKNLK